MALNKIFTGMEQGPEAIDSNFTQLQDIGNQWNRATSWKNLDVTGANFENDTATLPVRIYRYGKVVHLMGSLKHVSKTGDVLTIPVGYRPIHDIHQDLPEQSGNIGYSARAYIKNNVLSIVAIYGANPIWIDSITYVTEDDFPS